MKTFLEVSVIIFITGSILAIKYYRNMIKPVRKQMKQAVASDTIRTFQS
jgi:hypothetical protein